MADILILFIVFFTRTSYLLLQTFFFIKKKKEKKLFDFLVVVRGFVGGTFGESLLFVSHNKL